MTVNRISPRTAAWVLFAACATPLLCQFGNEPQKPLPPPAVNWTQEQDQKNMTDQLGIQALRRRSKRQRERPESLQLRRIEGQSMAQLSRSAHLEQWPESDHAGDVVEATPPGDCG
jgi:hypothetical protein